MKKFLLGLTVLLTVVAANSQAFAYFENGNLTLSVYNQNDLDLGVDLGLAADLVASTDTNVVLAAAGTVSLDKFTVGSWSDLSASAWYGNSTTFQMYIATTEETSRAVTIPSIVAFMNSTSAVRINGYGDSNNGEQYAVISSTEINSYDQKVNLASHSPGTFGGVMSTGSYLLEANLADLATGGYADLFLHYYAPQVDWAGGSEADAVIRLMADGSVVLNPNDTPEVPLPGSLILLSSGLLGMIGIRRKNA